MCVQSKETCHRLKIHEPDDQLSENSGVNRCASYPRAQRSIGRMQFRIDMQSESRMYVCMYREKRSNVTAMAERIFPRNRENDIFFLLIKFISFESISFSKCRSLLIMYAIEHG